MQLVRRQHIVLDASWNSPYRGLGTLHSRDYFHDLQVQGSIIVWLRHPTMPQLSEHLGKSIVKFILGWRSPSLAKP